MRSYSRRDFLKRAGSALVGTALAGSLPRGLHAGAERRPNIVFLMIDTLRADHCSCYGYGRRTTPALDAIARDGARFTHCIAPSSWTTPSVMTMFTGMSPIHHGVVSMRNRLPDGVPTLAGELGRLGYYTLGTLCNPCAAGGMGFGHGFDLYDDFTILADLDVGLFEMGGGDRRRDIISSATSKATTDLALKHVKAAPQGRPYFLFVLYFDPHDDYVPPGKYASMFDPRYTGRADGRVHHLPRKYTFPTEQDLEHTVALYDGEIRHVDQEVGRLLAELQRRGGYSDDDLLIVTSDHGEEFCEHGGIKHGTTLYEEVVHVPLLFHWPGRIPAGKEVSGIVSHDDLFATVMDAAGGATPAHVPNTSLLRVAAGKERIGRLGVGMHTVLEAEKIGLRTVEWAVVRDGATGKEEAFRLKDDPGQHSPMDPASAKEAAHLAQLMGEWVEEQKALGKKMAAGSTDEPKLQDAQLQALESLGYMQ